MQIIYLSIYLIIGFFLMHWKIKITSGKKKKKNWKYLDFNLNNRLSSGRNRELNYRIIFITIFTIPYHYIKILYFIIIYCINKIIIFNGYYVNLMLKCL